MIYTLHMLLYFRSFGKGHIKVIYASPSIHKENTNAETPNIKIRWTTASRTLASNILQIPHKLSDKLQLLKMISNCCV
jgi:hypothetical protein